MKLSSNDLIFLGVCAFTIGSIVIVRGYLGTRHPLEFATFLGTNPFQIKSSIIQKWDTIWGVGWLLIAVWLSIWGFAKIRRGIPSEPMIVFQFPMFFVVFGSIILFFGLTFLLSDLLSKNEYIPILLQNQRKLYQREKMYLATGGLRDEEQGRADLQVPESTRKKRLADVTSTLNQIGALLDIPRKQDENDQRYLERLGVFFERKKN